MKRMIALLVSMVTILSMMTFTAQSAYAATPAMKYNNAPIKLSKNIPTLDGKISPDEGWSSKAMLDNMHVGGYARSNPLTTTTEIYFSYSDEGLYVGIKSHDEGAAYVVRFYDEDDKWNGSFSYPDPQAGTYDENNYPVSLPDGTRIDAALRSADSYNSIINRRDPNKEHIENAFWYAGCGNTFRYCMGSDEVEWKNYTFEDGDVFALTIDPTAYVWNEIKKGSYKVNNNGKNPYPDDPHYDPTRDTSFLKPIQYNFGVFEGDEVRVVTSPYRKEDITDKCKAAAKLTKYDYCLEVMIPWSQIVDDANACIKYHGMSKTITKANCIRSGIQHKAAIHFLDRFYDDEAGYNDTWNRYVTPCDKCADGTDGAASDCESTKTLGLTLVMPGTYDPSENTGYGDLPAGAWFTEACIWCAEHGYMSGTGVGTFSPNATLTRAQFVQILAKLENVDLDAIPFRKIFEDVVFGKWYSKAVTWAVDFGVTGGVGDGMFAPNAQVTRAQLAVFLRTYAEKKGISTSDKANITGYADYNKVPGWAKDALAWAVNVGLISGTDATHLSPNNVATRAQAAVIIKNFCEKVK